MVEGVSGCREMDGAWDFAREGAVVVVFREVRWGGDGGKDGRGFGCR